MLEYNSEIYINKETSKSVIESIVQNNIIDYKKLNIHKYTQKIEELRKEYLKYKNNKVNNPYKYYVFWEIVKKKFNDSKISLIKRNQKTKNNNYNIIFSEFGKAIGFNPSLLTLLIFDKEIKSIVKSDNFFTKLQKAAELENVKISEKLKMLNCIEKKHIDLITPLCPDYEHVKIASGLYKYTFNKLNDDVGIIGKRLISRMKEIHDCFKKSGIKFTHSLFYGDFEALSKKNCERVKITEEEFIDKLNNSVSKLKKINCGAKKIGLLVQNFTTKKKWEKLCLLNQKKIKLKYEKSLEYKRVISEIVTSRTALYSCWFPGMPKEKYRDLVIQQGAEYASMSDLFVKNYKNPFVIAMDHPKMKIFYNLNNNITVVYGRPGYE